MDRAIYLVFGLAVGAVFNLLFIGFGGPLLAIVLGSLPSRMAMDYTYGFPPGLDDLSRMLRKVSMGNALATFLIGLPFRSWQISLAVALTSLLTFEMTAKIILKRIKKGEQKIA